MITVKTREKDAATSSGYLGEQSVQHFGAPPAEMLTLRQLRDRVNPKKREE